MAKGRMGNHNNKAHPADKMMPKHMTWETPYLIVEKLGSRGSRTELKRFHTRKSRQYLKRMLLRESDE